MDFCMVMSQQVLFSWFCCSSLKTLAIIFYFSIIISLIGMWWFQSLQIATLIWAICFRFCYWYFHVRSGNSNWWSIYMAYFQMDNQALVTAFTLWRMWFSWYLVILETKWHWKDMDVGTHIQWFWTRRNDSNYWVDFF